MNKNIKLEILDLGNDEYKKLKNNLSHLLHYLSPIWNKNFFFEDEYAANTVCSQGVIDYTVDMLGLNFFNKVLNRLYKSSLVQWIKVMQYNSNFLNQELTNNTIDVFLNSQNQIKLRENQVIVRHYNDLVLSKNKLMKYDFLNFEMLYNVLKLIQASLSYYELKNHIQKSKIQDAIKIDWNDVDPKLEPKEIEILEIIEE